MLSGVISPNVLILRSETLLTISPLSRKTAIRSVISCLLPDVGNPLFLQ